VGRGRKVFLSHTSEFAEHPKGRSYIGHAEAACIENEFLVGDMSHWSASTMRPADVCRQRLGECDVYIGIIGFRYGSPVPEEPELSYTELEFEEACRLELPVLIFLLHDEGKERAELGSSDQHYPERQDSFRRRLLASELTVAHFRNEYDLANLIGKSLRDLSKSRRESLFMAGRVPPDAVPRPELDQLCERVRAAARLAAAGPSDVGSLSTAVYGPGGFGKTILADWACAELQDEFPDGVLRVMFGEEPSEQQKIGWYRDLVLAFDAHCPTFATAFMAAAHLNGVLARRRVLLVLDDVWRRSDIDPFFQRGPSTVVLITTPDPDAVPEGVTTIRVDQLSDSQTQQILARGLDTGTVDFSELIRRTGRWPLLASLVNGVLSDEVHEGRNLAEAVKEVTRALAQRGPAVLDPGDRVEGRKAITTTIDLSISSLQRGGGSAAVEQYKSLAIFPEGVDVPLALLARWWEIEQLQVRRIARKLLRLSLIESYDVDRETVRLRDVLRGYLWFGLTRDARRAMHTAFVEAHLPSTGHWADLPDDAAYLWRWGAFHLHGAGRSDELVSTIRDINYLAKKVLLCGTRSVLEDLALAADAEARERLEWFRRYSHLLQGLTEPTDVAATLMARPRAQTLVDGSRERPTADRLRYAPGWSCPEPAVTALDRVLGAHQRRVQACVWSPDGSLVASVDGDGFVQLLDRDGHGRPVEIGGEAWVLSLAWSPDGNELAIGDDDGLVGTWGVDGLSRNPQVGRHHNGARMVAWSPDGEWIASGDDDAVRVWPARGGIEPPPLERAGCWVRAMAWSPDGRSLACAYDDGMVGTWATDRPGALVELGRHDGGAFAVSWSADARLVISGGGDGAVRLWSVHGDQPPLRLDSGVSPVLALAVSADGRLASGSGDGVLRTWAGIGAAKPIDVGRHEGGVLAVSWRPDDGALTSGGRDGALRLWQVDSGAVASDHVDDPVLSVGWSADGRWLASGTRGGCVHLWNASGAEEREPLFHDAAVQAVGWSSDGRYLACGCEDGRVRIHDAISGAEILRRPATGNSLRKLAWSPGSSRLACVGGDGAVAIWRPGPARGPYGERVRALAWSPGGQRFVTGDDNGRIQLWEVSAHREPEELGHRFEHPVRAIGWSPDERLLATGHNDGTVWLWGPNANDEPIELGRHRRDVHDVAWSPDGSRVVTVGDDNFLKVWRVPTDNPGQAELSCVLAVDGTLNGLAWRPGSELLAIAGSHGVYVFQIAGSVGVIT
jgi:YD repeat-containing protein